MKILFRTMRYNWRYIFSKSNKIAVVLFSVWGFVTLVSSANNCSRAYFDGNLFCYSNRGHDLYESKKTSENF